METVVDLWGKYPFIRSLFFFLAVKRKLQYCISQNSKKYVNGYIFCKLEFSEQNNVSLFTINTFLTNLYLCLCFPFFSLLYFVKPTQPNDPHKIRILDRCLHLPIQRRFTGWLCKVFGVSLYETIIWFTCPSKVFHEGIPLIEVWQKLANLLPFNSSDYDCYVLTLCDSSVRSAWIMF